MWMRNLVCVCVSTVRCITNNYLLLERVRSRARRCMCNEPDPIQCKKFCAHINGEIRILYALEVPIASNKQNEIENWKLVEAKWYKMLIQSTFCEYGSIIRRNELQSYHRLLLFLRTWWENAKFIFSRQLFLWFAFHFWHGTVVVGLQRLDCYV